MSKPYLSPSQIDLCCRCPEAYRRRYIEGERIPPGIALLRGSGVHGGAATNFAQKIETHNDLPEPEIVDAAVNTFESRVKADGVELTAEERSIGKRNVLAQAKDSTAKLAGFHAREQAPDYQPQLVEATVRLDIPQSTHDLLGKIDLLDDRHQVVDFKTGGKSKSQSDADTSIQLTSYAALTAASTGKPPSAIKLDCIVDQKTQTKRQILHTTRGPNDYQALSNRINTVLKVIESGVFPPTTPNAWWCSKRWCGFAESCPYFSGKD